MPRSFCGRGDIVKEIFLWKIVQLVIFFEHHNYSSNNKQPDFTIKVLDGQGLRRVYIKVVLLSKNVDHNDLMVTMRSILLMVDCMLFLSLGKTPANNPYGCPSFDITCESDTNTINLEIGYEGFNRDLLKEQFYLTSLGMKEHMYYHQLNDE